MKRVTITLFVLHLTSFFVLPLEKSVPRRVVLLNFVNLKQQQEIDYLSISIPEAFIMPLEKTKSFYIMDRGWIQKVSKNLAIQQDSLYKKENALKIGKALDADIVIMGMYVPVGNKVQIQAQAIDVQTGRVRVTRRKVANLDSSIFNSIDILVNSMVSEMKKKLPPLPISAYKNRKQISSLEKQFNEDYKSFFADKRFRLGLTFSYMPVLNEVNEVIPSFMSTQLRIEHRPYFHYFVPFLSGSLLYVQPKKKVNASILYSAGGGLGFFIQQLSFEYLPYLSGGILFGQWKNYSVFRIPYAEVGVRVQYKLFSRFFLELTPAFISFFDPQDIIFGISLYGGGSYAF